MKVHPESTNERNKREPRSASPKVCGRLEERDERTDSEPKSCQNLPPLHERREEVWVLSSQLEHGCDIPGMRISLAEVLHCLRERRRKRAALQLCDTGLNPFYGNDELNKKWGELRMADEGRKRHSGEGLGTNLDLDV